MAQVKPSIRLAGPQVFGAVDGWLRFIVGLKLQPEGVAGIDGRR